jgi:toxin ParE1/3/4
VTRKVQRSEAAVDDLLGIVDSLFTDAGMDVALDTEQRLDAAIESLEELSNRGRVVPELRVHGITTYREIIAMPYRVIYRVEPHEVWVVAVLDHRRDLTALLHERACRDRGR